MVYAKFGGQTECIMGNWKIENSWKFLLNSAQSYWLLRGHMTSNNETVSHHHGNNAKKKTSEGNNAILPANVD